MKWKDSHIGDFIQNGSAGIQTGPFGTQLSANEYVPEGTPVINVRNLGYANLRSEKLEYISSHTVERLKVHLIQENDIVFGRKGAVDRHLIVSKDQEKWLQGSDCIRLRFFGDEVVPRFVSYAFLQKSHQQWMLTQSGSKATMASLNQEIISRIPLRLPPRQIQKSIVSILSSYDSYTENNKRRIELLEKSVCLLYEEWFVRLRFPGYSSNLGIDGIPKGWQRRSIGEFIEGGHIHLQTGPFGTQLKASEYVESGIPVINVRNIGYGDLRDEKLEYLPDEVAERLSTHILREGDIVFGRKGAVDRHLLVMQAQKGWVQGSDCIRLRILFNAISPEYLTFAFRQPNHHEWMLRQCGNKATMASLNHDVISRIPVIVPAAPILAEFQVFARNCLTQIATLSLQNKKLRAARDLLLPRLMSGEIEV